MSDTECDLEVLTSLLNQDSDSEAAENLQGTANTEHISKMQDQKNGEAAFAEKDPCELDFEDEIDIDVFAELLEDNLVDETKCTNSVSNHSENSSDKNISAGNCQVVQDQVTAASLGLELSDDEESLQSEANGSLAGGANRVSSFYNSFSNVLNDSTRTKVAINSNKGKAQKNEEVDPLEQELRKMEQRMQKIKEELAKKKKLDLINPDGTAKRFTLLTNPADRIREKASILTPVEKEKLLKRLHDNKASHVHGGDTDSEDDEDNRNPFETQYNSFGRAVKKNLNANNVDNSNNSRQSKLSAGAVGYSNVSCTNNVAKSRVSCSINSESTFSTLQSLAQKRQEVLEKLKSPQQSWQDASGSLVSLKTGKAIVLTEAERNAVQCPFSGIYIMNPLVPLSVLRERMEGRRHVLLSSIPLHLRGGEMEGDWATIAVLVAKSQPKTSQKGSQYSIWQLSDLRDCSKTVGLFLFAGAHSSLWKTAVGAVVGMLNAQVMKDREGESSSNLVTLSINNPLRVMEVGSARDLGWCKGRTKANAACRQFVNKSVCEFCVFHVQREYQRTAAQRADLQSSFSRGGPKNGLKNKVLGKDQVFYGGHLYTGGGGGSNMNGSISGPAIPAHQSTRHKAKDLATMSSLKLQLSSKELREEELRQQLKNKDLKEEDRKKSFVLKHLSQGEIVAAREMVKENDGLGTRLLAPTPGARNLLRHKAQEDTKAARRENEAKGIVTAVTARDLLSMTQRQREQQRMQQRQRAPQFASGGPSVSFSTSSPRRDPGATPQLGRGFLPGQDIDLDISSGCKKTFDPAKAKALAILKRTGTTLKTTDKNVVRNKDKTADPDFKEKVQKRLRESLTSEDCDKGNGSEAENDASFSKKPRVEASRRSLLGNVDLNQDKIAAMLEKKSMHSNLVEAEEDALMEKYYNKLEHREMLEEKMASVMEVPTSAVVCKTCKYTSVMQSQYCKDQGHIVKSVKASKRFFECVKCKRRTVSLEKMPVKSCSNCEGGSWKRVAMGKARKGPTLDSEVLSLRGNEQQHYGGVAGKVYLNIDG